MYSDERRKSGELFHALINADTLTMGERRPALSLPDITEQKRPSR
jgi:hypothetical protein